jgi:hypothetical protein
MPGIRVKGYDIRFKEFDLRERPHVHIFKGGKTAKYWIDRIELFDSGRFKNHELTEIERILQESQVELREIWERETKKLR